MTAATERLRAAMLALIGHAPERIEPGKLQRFATSERRGDSAGWCKLFDDGRGAVFGDFRTGASEVWTHGERSAMTRAQRIEVARQVAAATAERAAEQRRQWAINGERNAELWRQCVPLVPGDPVTQYLKRRGIAGVWPLPAALRFHPRLTWWHDGVKTGEHPAMVAPLVDTPGRIVALHRTCLTRDGRKADVLNPKKLTGASGPLAGGAIPLHKPVNGRIGVAEGIETALAAWCATALPTVAAYSAGALAAWQWPAGVRHLVVFGDNDRAGRTAADALRQRAVAAGLRCDLMLPTDEGADWCDVWAGGRAVTVDAGGAA